MRLESIPAGPNDSEHPSLSYFISLSVCEDPSVEAMVLSSLSRAITRTPPLLPEHIPSVLAPRMQELSSLQTEANFCLRILCMKVALSQSLVFNADMKIRDAVSSNMASFLAGGCEEIDTDALDAFLQAEYIANGIVSPPVTGFISQADFLRIFGYTEVFRSTVMTYISDLALFALRFPESGTDQIIQGVFPRPNECIGQQIFPRLAAIGQGLARVVSACLSDIREEYQEFLASA